MAEVAVSAALLLVEAVSVFLELKAKSKANNVHDELEGITLKLKQAQTYLRQHDGRCQTELQAAETAQIRGLAHRIEDALDGFMYKFPHHFHNHRISKVAHRLIPFRGRGALDELSSEIERIKNKANDIIAFKQLTAVSTPILESGSSSRTDRGAGDNFVPFPGEDDTFGYEEIKVNLIAQLTAMEQHKHMAIAVVGPGGSGKSTLVKNAYHDNKVKVHFQCRAWLRVSPPSDKVALINDMILQFQDEKKRWQYLQDGEFVSNSFAKGDKRSHVKRYLQQKRYLIVLDDLWNTDDLDYIESFVPKNNMGSRIIVTTHKLDVARFHGESPRCVHDLSKGLPAEAAWNLFCKTAFLTNNGECPPELEDIAQRIVTKCGGSPFAILSISGILARKGKLPAEWLTFHDSLGSEIGTDPHRIVSKTLLPSYNDLSITLKRCFLYLSVFPENNPIERGRLVRLWMAEGFVEHTQGKSLERVADDYLNELIARNLIHVTERNFDGRARICGVQNLVHHFIANKCKENFITIFSEKDFTTSDNGDPPRRVSVHEASLDLSKRSLGSVRSLFVFALIDDFQSKVRQFIGQFKLLKVLDLQGSSLEDFPTEICHLNLLRYLSLRGTNIKTIPGSIKNLVYIESLDLKQTQVRKLPKDILRLPNLKYLLVYLYDVKNYVTFESVKGVEIDPGVGVFSELQKLTLVKANSRRFIEELGKLDNLRKLGLIDLKPQYGQSLCASIQSMKQLSCLDLRSDYMRNHLDLDYMSELACKLQLQRLYLKGRLTKVPKWISSLYSLVRIGLQWSKLQQSPIPVLQVLPNLIEVRLVDAFIGDKLEFEAENFCKLKKLHIEEFTELNTIIIQENAMPKLEKLSLLKCEKLRLLPLGINHLAHLEELLAYDMPTDFTSALQARSEDHGMVEHIPVIRSVYLENNGQWVLKDLS